MRFRQSGSSDETVLSNIETQIADLNGKIKTLSFRAEKTGKVLKKDGQKASERHRTSLETMVTAVNTLNKPIEEKKFAIRGKTKSQFKNGRAKSLVFTSDTITSASTSVSSLC